MPNSLSKNILEVLLPQGAIWDYKPGAGLDQTLDGIAIGDDAIISSMSELAYIRDPQKTPILDDLEREFGIVKNNNFTEQQRRDLLSLAKVKRQSDGTWLFLQNLLRGAGFDVYVHPNDPPVNPDFFILGAQPLIVCDNENAVCDNENAVCDAYGGVIIEESINYFGNPDSYFGNPDAYFGAVDEIAGFSGEVLVNQDFYNYEKNYLIVCDNENAVCDAYGGIIVEESVNYFGNPDAYFGNPDAYFGAVDEIAGFSGEVLVNQDFYNYEKNHLIVCDNEGAVCDNQNVVTDSYNTLIKIPINYTIPANPGYWPLVFFVGGPAMRDPDTGAIISIQVANVPLERRDEFRAMILKIKPMYSWAVLVVKYI